MHKKRDRCDFGPVKIGIIINEIKNTFFQNRGVKMIKGFINPDGKPIAANMICEGSNRTAAMMCYEIGLLPGVDENENVIIMRNGKPEISKEIVCELDFDDPNAQILFPLEIEAMKREQPDEPKFETTDINDIQDKVEQGIKTTFCGKDTIGPNDGPKCKTEYDRIVKNTDRDPIVPPGQKPNENRIGSGIS